MSQTSSSAGSALTSTLQPVSSLAGKKAPDSPQHDQLVAQTQKWVAQTFYGTLLKQVRNSPFRSELMDGGRGGQVFGSMYDQRIAEHMARGAGSKLVNSIVKRIEAKQAYQKAARKKGDSSHGETKSPHGETKTPRENKSTHPLHTAPTRSPHVPANLRA
jgi:Rod binding domain-containing protein